jgi:hypothetical protein
VGGQTVNQKLNQVKIGQTGSSTQEGLDFKKAVLSLFSEKQA